jgi:hypothetical protein
VHATLLYLLDYWTIQNPCEFFFLLSSLFLASFVSMHATLLFVYLHYIGEEEEKYWKQLQEKRESKFDNGRFVFSFLSLQQI